MWRDESLLSPIRAGSRPGTFRQKEAGCHIFNENRHDSGGAQAYKMKMPEAFHIKTGFLIEIMNPAFSHERLWAGI